MSPPLVSEDPPPFSDFLEADAGWQEIQEELVKVTKLVTSANTEMIRGMRERMRQALEQEASNYKSKLKKDYREVYGDILALHRLNEDHVEWMREESWDFLQRVKEYARSSQISVDSLLAYHLPEVHVKRANLFNIFQQLKAEQTPGLSRKEMTAAWEEAKAEHEDDMDEYEQMLRRQHLEFLHAHSKKRNQGTVLRQVADQFGDMVCLSKPTKKVASNRVMCFQSRTAEYVHGVAIIGIAAHVDFLEGNAVNQVHPICANIEQANILKAALSNEVFMEAVTNALRCVLSGLLEQVI
jgi:hypothetical protein